VGGGERRGRDGCERCDCGGEQRCSDMSFVRCFEIFLNVRREIRHLYKNKIMKGIKMIIRMITTFYV
jgi:hypothetical protein